MKKTEAKINGNSLNVFGAMLVDYAVGPVSYENNYYLPSKSLIPVKLKGKVGLRKVTMTLDVIGDAEGSIALNISNLTAILMGEAELILPDGYYYSCVFSQASTPEEKAPWIKRVKFEFLGYRHGPLETVAIADGDEVFIKGNFETPIRYTIVPGADTTVTVNGIRITDVTSTVTIDGYTSKVTMDRLNKFGDTDILEFPKFTAGYHTMYVTGDCAVTMEYYPIYM